MATISPEPSSQAPKESESAPSEKSSSSNGLIVVFFFAGVVVVILFVIGAVLAIKKYGHWRAEVARKNLLRQETAENIELLRTHMRVVGDRTELLRSNIL